MPERVKMLTMREYVSSNGSTYFKGWLGDSVLVMTRDGKAQCSGNEVARWSIFVEEKPVPAAPSKGAPNTTIPAGVEVKKLPAQQPKTTKPVQRTVSGKQPATSSEPPPW